MTGHHSAVTVHRETVLEEHLVDILVTGQGYLLRYQRSTTGLLPWTVRLSCGL